MMVGINFGQSTERLSGHSGLRIKQQSFFIAFLFIISALVADVPVHGAEGLEIAVSPATVSLKPGTTQQFTAVVNGVPTRVRWRATGGIITEDGQFTAGQTTGTFRVTAVSTWGWRRASAVVVIASDRVCKQVQLTPGSATLPAGATQKFSATAMWSDGTTGPVPVTWGGTGGVVDNSGLYTAGQTPGTYQVVATQTGTIQSGSATITVTAPRTLLQIAVAPVSATLQGGATHQFSATGVWSDGLAGAADVTWSATGGTITSAGLYTAGPTPGNYQVTARQSGGTLTSSAAVTVTAPRTLSRIDVAPGSATVQTGVTQQFSASGVWSDGTTGPVTATWNATGGTITSAGLYTAGPTPGNYQVTARENGGTLTSSAAVTVTAPRTLRRIDVAPGSATLQSGVTQQFSASGVWSDGTTGPVAATWNATGGTITSAGLYTAGQTASSFQVTATHTSGMSGTASVTITAAPPPPPPPAPAPGSDCAVDGGSSSAPSALGSVISTQTQCTEFVLGDGYYAPTTITRSGVTVRALNHCQAQVKPELSIRGQNVTVDGVSVTAAGVAVTVYASGVRVQNTCIQGFGKTQYGNGIWVMQEALDPDNLIHITGNALDDWGGAQFSGGIAIGKAADNPNVPTRVSVEIVGNRITGGPTMPGIYNAAIQSFHPFVATHNYVDTVSGTSIQNKTFGSRIACNELVNVIGDGALYNRSSSHNVWEYNIVRDSEVGIDHFMGDSNVFRGNIIHNVSYFGRVKNQDMGSTNLLIENNTFSRSTAWAAFIWDATSGGPLSNILWGRNVFHTTNGAAIHAPTELNAAWDETGNIFYLASRPAGTTGASGTSRTMNPLINPPSNYAPLEPTAVGTGAPWPLPCSGG